MDICIATTTFSKTMDVRARLALKTIEEARKHDFPILVVDGGSAPEFQCEVVRLGALRIDQEELGMGPSRRQCLRYAKIVVDKFGTATNWAIFWTEPEKWPIIRFIRAMAAKMETAEADIIVPARKSMASYPAIQEVAERLGNMYFAKTTGHELDVWIGPRLIGPRAIPLFLNYKGEYGDKWDSIFVPICRAVKTGLKVVGCEVDYVHPAEQTEVEEKDPFMDLRRLNQLKNLVPAFYGEMNPEFHGKAKELGLL